MSLLWYIVQEKYVKMVLLYEVSFEIVFSWVLNFNWIFVSEKIVNERKPRFFLDFLSVCERIFKVLPNGDRFSNVWQGELDELFICT